MEITPEYNENSFSFGFNQGKEMTIGNAAHLFSLLSRNLYSNPKVAMFREIITNAWDAHIAANKSDTPIKIKADGNTITISDFGHGISPKDFMSLYGQVGGSNKRNDNRQTGGMGIGKLAPLACVSGFTINSHHLGECTVYRIDGPSEASKGVPTVTEIVKTSTDRSGLDVILPVTLNDEYSKIIYHILITGSIKSIFNGEEVIVTPDENVLVQNDLILNNFKKSILLKYGNIIYPIPTSLEHSNTSIKGGLSLIIKLEPGTATVTPNREELIITDSNKKKIEKVIDAGYKKYIKEIKHQIITNCKIESLVNGLSVSNVNYDFDRKKNFFTLDKKDIIPIYNDYINLLNNEEKRGLFNLVTKTKGKWNKCNEYETIKKLLCKAGATVNGKNGRYLPKDTIYNSVYNDTRLINNNLLINKSITIHSGPKSINDADTLVIRVKRTVDKELLVKSIKDKFPKFEIKIIDDVTPKKKEIKEKEKLHCASLFPLNKGEDFIELTRIYEGTVSNPKYIFIRDSDVHFLNYRNMLRKVPPEVLKEYGVCFGTIDKIKPYLRLRKEKPKTIQDFFMDYINKYITTGVFSKMSKYISPKLLLNGDIPVKVASALLDDIEFNEADLAFIQMLCYHGKSIYEVRREIGYIYKDTKPTNLDAYLLSINWGIVEEYGLFDNVIKFIKDQQK